jgi:hypothetical protein
MTASTLDSELKSLIMQYVTGQLEEKRFRVAYRRLVRLRTLLGRQ